MSALVKWLKCYVYYLAIWQDKIWNENLKNWEKISCENAHGSKKNAPLETILSSCEFALQFFPSFVWYYAAGQSILKSTTQIPKWNSLQLTIRPHLDVLWHGLPRDKRYSRKKNTVIFLDSAVKALT